MALFDFQLRCVHAAISPNTPVIVAAMVKHMPGSARQRVAAILGSGEGSLTEHRARCIRSTTHPDAPGPPARPAAGGPLRP